MIRNRLSWPTVALVGATGLASVPWAFGYVLPQRGGPSLLLAALSGYSPFGVLAVLVVAWALRRWAALATAAVLLVTQVATLGPLFVGDGTPRPGRAVLRVMTVNLYFGRADPAQLLQLVRSRRVDVLALEEMTPDAVARLERAGLRRELPYAVSRPGPSASGTGLWTRLPITEVPAPRLRFNAAAGDIRVAGAVVRLRALHPVTPVPSAGAWRRDFAAMRAQQRADLGVATILLGDFNASVHHRELRRLLAGRWRDAAEADGAGLARTWSPRVDGFSVLDLDHVLVDRGMTVAGYETVRIRGTDHRAVIVAVSL